MNSLVLEHEPRATSVSVTNQRLTVDLADGRNVSVPLDWYPRLLHASEKERTNWQILGEGYGIEWPDVDEHISVEALLAGRRSGESKASLERWLASRRS
jgi:uncharacterized protein DUF2442